MKSIALILPLFFAATTAAGASEPSPAADWNSRRAADAVLQRLVRVTGPEVKGAHDSGLAVVHGRAYVVAEASDERSGESPAWPEIYATLSIVDLRTMKLEKTLRMARGGQVFENETLPEGACFVPRIWPKDERTLRCWFASEAPGKRQSQTWCIDFDLATQRFENRISRAKLKTAFGTFDFEPRRLHDAAIAEGFSKSKPAKDFGLYVIDAPKRIDGRLYAALNNFAAGQNALALLHDDLETFEIVGCFHEPASASLTESAVHRLPDGLWTAICRQEGADRNYLFATSADGRAWSPAVARDFVPNGTNSKPTFDRFGGTYYLGWQEKTQVGGASRSVFNIDVSRDGKSWRRKYRFETERSFQYPSFYEYDGAIWLSVTQGDASPSRKERIMFGKLEDLPRAAPSVETPGR